MTEDRFRPWNGIFVRLFFPLIIVLLTIFFLLHTLTLSTVNNFLEKHMRQEMQWMTSSVFDICDRNLNDFLFMSSGALINHAIVQARSMDEIEEYLDGRNLSGIIADSSGMPVIFRRLPLEHESLFEKTANLPTISIIKIMDREYLVGKVEFEPWQWDMIILQDISHYEAMLKEIKNVYWALAGMLGTAVLFFVFLTMVNVSRPLSRIIGKIKNEEFPDYRGVSEFAYLSRAIGQMMQSISSKNDFISNLFDTLSAVVLVVDKDGRVTMVNNYLCSLSGFERREIVGRMLWEMVPRKKSKFIQKIFKQHKDGFMVNGEELSILSKSGKIINVLWHSRQIQDRESGMDLIIYTGSDITGLKQIEKSLEKERMLIYSLFESSPLAQMVISLNGEVLDVNEQFLQLTGYEAKDIHDLDEWLFQVTGDETLVQEFRSRWFSSASGPWDPKQVRIKDKSGNHREVEFTFSSLPDGRIVSFLTDVTEKVHQENENRRMVKELYQARKMEAIGVLAGGIAHDFNNILQAISVQVQAMEIELNKEAKPKKPYFQRIESLTDRGMSIVKRILTFSRKVEPELSRVNINDLVGQEVALMRQALPKMIEIIEHPGPDISQVYIDKHQMELVLMNLINNARDSIPHTGRIEISTREVMVDENFDKDGKMDRGRYVVLTVRDTGEGMEEKVMDQMFDPFYTTKGPGKGTGLGLPTVYGIVKKHKGFIFCSSKPGRGSEFKIFIPVEEHDSLQNKALKPDVEPPTLKGHETILVVDDEDDIRELTLEMLESFGYRTFGAESGERALEIYASQKIDFVLMDLGMPGMGGEKCAQKILEADPEARIIIASGYMDHPMARDPQKFGLADFISKPYQVKDALGKIRHFLGQ